MRAIDWRRLLTEHRIPFAESGPNVKRGELAIACPFCGSADPSKHMGLNLESGWWSCWRNRSAHSGKSPLRLIMRLLSVPYGRARELAGLGDDYVDPEGFDAIAARLMGRNKDIRPEQMDRRFLTLDRDFLPITDGMRTRRFWNYLYAERGFNGSSAAGRDVDLLCHLYDLRAGTRGAWQDRLVIPYYLDDKLVTWTGRAISSAVIRYKDLDLATSLLAPKDTLYNHDCIAGGGKALVIQEGPIDVLKVDFYGQPYGVRSVGLSTNSLKDAQTYLLQLAADKFERVIVMMDNASSLGLIDSMRMKQELFFLNNVSIEPVPYGVKDGGLLTPRQVINWAQTL